MLMWLIVIISAYLFFGFSSLCDKLVLAGKTVQGIPRALQPKSYTFYVGVFSLLVILLIPFVKFGLPSATGLIWIILDAIVHIIGLYTMYVAIEKFEISKVVSTIIAAQTIFIFILSWLFWRHEIMPTIDILALVLLLIGSVIISVGKNIKITVDYLKITIFSALMFSLDYIFLKLVFLNQPFLQGIIWIGIFIFLFVLIFLISKKSRKEIFSKQMIINKKTQALFLCAQGCGGVGNFMQSFAISLAPVAFLAIVNSLKGVQFFFLFIMTLFISYFYPKILKEELSKRIIVQKIIAIIFIAGGLAILVLY